jgi:hypothetical protein
MRNACLLSCTMHVYIHAQCMSISMRNACPVLLYFICCLFAYRICNIKYNIEKYTFSSFFHARRHASSWVKFPSTGFKLSSSATTAGEIPCLNDASVDSKHCWNFSLKPAMKATRLEGTAANAQCVQGWRTLRAQNYVCVLRMRYACMLPHTLKNQKILIQSNSQILIQSNL